MRLRGSGVNKPTKGSKPSLWSVSSTPIGWVYGELWTLPASDPEMPLPEPSKAPTDVDEGDADGVCL